MHCHRLARQLHLAEDTERIVLVGNPNVGKSVIFNALTGMYVDVSNFPGTTVEISHGKWGEADIIDTPGIYGISSFNEEETVARDVILQADKVVNVVDAVHLDRDLFLTLQLIDMQIPTVVALNMMDEAKEMGLDINVERLQELLGVPVIPTVAVTGEGFPQLKQAIATACPGKSDPELTRDLVAIMTYIHSRREAVLALEADSAVLRRYEVPPHLAPGEAKRDEIYLRRRHRVDDIVEEVVCQSTVTTKWKQRLSSLMLRPLTGIPLLLLTLYLMYQLIGVFIAGTVVGITEEIIMQGYYEPFVRGLVAKAIPIDSALGVILVGEFGILTMTITYLFGLLLPLVVGFYAALAILEDSGYLPRIATLVDRLLTRLGLNGRAVIPLILGLGCVTMATITTRILGSRRERTIATMLLALAVPCSAQLGVIAAMLSGIGTGWALLYIATIFFTFVIIGTVLHHLLPGCSTHLLVDLPTLRWPRWKNVGRKTVMKSVTFLREAGVLFFLGALLISTMQVTGLLEALQSAAAPLTVGWLQLPRETATAFIMGIVRRDFGAAGLYDMELTPLQTLVSLITITLFVPCIASMIVIFKERGWKEGVVIFASTFFLAFLIGGSVSQLIM